MIIPRNGRVVILDDKKEQAYPLIKVLSKAKVPFTYHSDDILLLPEEGQQYDDIRLLFLDINLSVSGTPETTIKSQLQTTLLRIIKPETPYVAVIWSLKENEYEELLNDLFQNRIPEIRPLARVLLTKSDFFSLEMIDEGKDTERTDYIERSDGFDVMVELNKRISASLGGLSSIEALIKWENVINKSSSSIIHEIISLAKNNKDFDIGLKNIYYKLAESMWGRQLQGNGPGDIINKAITILNQLLNDKIESEVSKGLDFKIITEINKPVDFEEKDKAILNSKILINNEIAAETYPGNVYRVLDGDLDKYPYKSLVADTLNIPIVVEKLYKKLTGEEIPANFNHFEYKNSEKKYSNFEKGIRKEIIESSIIINLEISPICDYAQKKWRANRLCPGILWNSAFNNYIAKSDNVYVSPLIIYKDIVYQLVLDLRYFTSTPLEILKENHPVFSLRHSLLVDIQSILGRHINRPGISALT